MFGVLTMRPRVTQQNRANTADDHNARPASASQRERRDRCVVQVEWPEHTALALHFSGRWSVANNVLCAAAKMRYTPINTSWIGYDLRECNSVSFPISFYVQYCLHWNIHLSNNLGHKFTVYNICIIPHLSNINCVSKRPPFIFWITQRKMNRF